MDLTVHIGIYNPRIIPISVKLVIWYDLASKANICSNFDPKKYFFEFWGSQEAKKAQKQLLKPYFGKLKHIHES